MEKTSELKRMERERTALFEEATRIVQAAEAQTSTVTAEEDARVLELMARVRTLEEQIRHRRRQSEHNEPRKGTTTNDESTLRSRIGISSSESRPDGRDSPITSCRGTADGL